MRSKGLSIGEEIEILYIHAISPSQQFLAPRDLVPFP